VKQQRSRNRFFLIALPLSALKI